jgi:hypothetical protein
VPIDQLQECGTLELAQQIVVHESSPTTKLPDQTRDQVSVEEEQSKSEVIHCILAGSVRMEG